MNDHFIVEVDQPINSILDGLAPRTSHVSAFDVSSKYLVFGASTGTVYLFHRLGYSFYKLITCAANQKISMVSMSPNETQVAVLIESKRTINVVNMSTNRSKNVQNDQIKAITHMIWNDTSNELYFANRFGYLSIISVSHFLIKSMFQNPLTTIVQLESKVIQMDLYKQFLLVTTIKYVYVFDLETDRFWEIRKNAEREGCGSCFFFGNKSTLYVCCAKEGLNLTYLRLNGNLENEQNVNKNIRQKCIPKISNDLKCHLDAFNGSDLQEENDLKCSILTFLNENTLISYETNCLLLIDVSKMEILSFKKFDSLITELKVIKKLVYVRTTNNNVHIFRIDTFDNFIKKSISKTQFELAFDFCSIISKKSPLQNNDKLILNNYVKYLNDKIPIDYTISDSLSMKSYEIKDSELKDNNIYDLYECYCNIDNINTGKLLILFRNYENIPDFTNFLDNFLLNYEKDNFIEQMTIWSKKVLLKYINNMTLIKPEFEQKLELTNNILKKNLKNIFIEVNRNYSQNNLCKNCNFALPIVKEDCPNYFELISKIIEFNFESDLDYCFEICQSLPYAWLCFFRQFQKNSIPQKYLKLSLQIDDVNLITSAKFNCPYNEIIELYYELKQGYCLNCNQTLNREISNLNWDSLGICLINNFGPLSAIQFLSQYSEIIPNGSFSLSFYQLFMNDC